LWARVQSYWLMGQEEGMDVRRIAERGAAFGVELPEHDVVQALLEFKEATAGEEQPFPDLGVVLKTSDDRFSSGGAMEPSEEVVSGT
jgi:hypothetical protein